PNQMLSSHAPVRYHQPRMSKRVPQGPRRQYEAVMNLTQYTDFSLRTLMFLAVAERSSTISEVASAFGISRNHLVKVVHRLAKQEFIISTRGKSGGIALARSPHRIRIGDVVRAMEPRFRLAECFDSETNRCPITPVCRLTGVLREAE